MTKLWTHRCELLALLIVLGLSAALSAAEPRKPNIIFIMVDDMGYHDLNAVESAKKAGKSGRNLTKPLKKPPPASYPASPVGIEKPISYQSSGERPAAAASLLKNASQRCLKGHTATMKRGVPDAPSRSLISIVRPAG